MLTTRPTIIRLALGAGAVTAILAASVSTAGISSAGTRSTGVRYAVNRPLCSTVLRPRYMTCFAMRRVNVSKGTTGAERYVTDQALNTGPAGGYTPDDLATAYEYDPTAHASNQTVGIVDWYDDPHIRTDLQQFESQYGLPHETAKSFRVVNQNGAVSPLPSSAKGVDTAGETSLDVETVRAVCNTCRILLVEANNGSVSNLATAENTAVRLGAREVSNSFGGPEGALPSSITSAFSHPGVAIAAATGDQGWYGWDVANNGSASTGSAYFPSTDPNVIAVGGTKMLLDAGGSISSQQAWNEDGTDDQAALSAGTALGAAGGGCSQLYHAPSWQKAYPGYSAAGCGGARLTADVAALADPETGFDTYDTWGTGDNGWITVGGTSLATPIITAMYALAGGPGQAEHPANSLYENATLDPSHVDDVTSGGTGFCGGDTTTSCGNFVFTSTSGQHVSPNALGVGNVDCSFPRDGSDPSSAPALSSECNAVTGFDGPTGVGTPLGTGLFTSTSPTVSVSAPSIAKLHKLLTFTATAAPTVSGSQLTTVTFQWGDGKSTTGTGLSVSHTYTKSGHFVISVVVQDNLGQQSLAKTSITVGKPLSIKASGPHTLAAHHTVAYSAKVTDPNTGGLVRRVTWSWGDGHKSTGASAHHSWKKAGRYRVTVTATDNTGVATTHTLTVKVH
jgi:PKD repeat protein